MNKKKIEQQIKQLRKELDEYNYKYYTLDSQEISDYKFDEKIYILQNLEKQYPEFFDSNSPTKKIGGDIIKKFSIVNHYTPMYSLKNVYNYKELINWENYLKKNINDCIEYVCELKYDGVSISLIYENKYLVRAVTRGNGLQGNDITNNIRTIKSIPLKLKCSYSFNFETRGEIILPLIGFQKINKERIKNGKDPYSNPRNTVSGILKIQDRTKVAKMPLDCLIYSIIGDNLPFNSQYKALKYAYQWGFNVPQTSKLCNTIQEVFQFINYWNINRNKLPYKIDGIVIKVNTYQQQNYLGNTSKFPHWAIAYKFQSERITTQILNVRFQIGRTGIITPVAELKPIFFNGTIIQRASLYNKNMIQNLGVYYNDIVFIEKCGEIIPKIVGIDLMQRKLITCHPIHFIKKCPDCKTELIKNKTGSYYYCPNNKHCSSQIIAKIQHFVSKKAMNIDCLGEETIKKFVEKKILYTISDLYTLKTSDFLHLDYINKKSAENIIEGIKKSKLVPFDRVLYGLSIRHVGETIAKKLANSLYSIDNIMKANNKFLINLDKIGEKIIKSLKEYFLIIENQKIIEKLKKHGIQLEQKNNLNIIQNSIVYKKSFLFTGKLSFINREKIEKIIESQGGEILKNVTPKLNFLIVGEKPGSKLEKAKFFNTIKILNEDDFIKLYNLFI